MFKSVVKLLKRIIYFVESVIEFYFVYNERWC